MSATTTSTETDSAFRYARSASTERRRRAEEDSTLDIQKMFKAMQDQMTALQTENAALKSRMEILESTNKKEIDTLKSRIQITETSNTLLTNRVALLESLFGRISTLESQFRGIEEKVTAVEATANSAHHKIHNHKHTLYGRCGGGDTMGIKFEPNY